MSSYSKELTDLLYDPDFRKWVTSGAFRASGNYWSEWRIQNPQLEETVKQAIAILLASHVEEEITESEVDAIVSGTWEQIRSHQKPATPLWRWGWVAAALVVGALFTWRNSTESPVSDSRVAEASPPLPAEQFNGSRKPMLLTLSDSSSVVLLPGSRLHYPTRFDADKREVTLTGEAFFEISKNAARPFFVHTQSITTRVIGTSFSVRAYAEEAEVNVTVKTGSVSVYRIAPESEEVPAGAITLLPDQHLVYNKEQHSMRQSVSPSASAALSLRKASFEFTDAPVTAILDSIAGAYGLQAVYDRASLQNCILTTSLTDTPLQGKLRIICKALGESAGYKLSEDKIEIWARGCD